MAAEAIYDTTDAESVAVVGAGFSGLAAAIWLTDEGYDVTVLEDRSRIGGRGRTDRSLGMPLDLGASWKHGTDGNPLTELAEAQELSTSATDDTYVLRRGDGCKIADEHVPGWLENILSVQHAVGADEREISGSACWLNSDYGGDEVILPGGCDQLLGAVRDRIEVRFGHVLRLGEITETGVSLQDGRSRKAAFYAVIITVPLGVLKQGAIDFSPSLPPKENRNHREAWDGDVR